jgi:hypothetical protein
MSNNEVFFDGNDPKLLRNLMEQHGTSEFPFYGKNEDGEDIEIHICKTSIILKTNQHNGWLRVNYFDESGLPAGETFEGRWR